VNKLPDNATLTKPLSGIKYDGEKPDMSLLQDVGLALLEVGKVLTAGCKKYSAGNWLLVKDNKIRYKAALLRHVMKEKYEEDDPELGLSHAACIATNALFCLELKLRDKMAKEKEKKNA
jgi:hypothetical protein